jgi:putative tryptophan/tyrosine transport system substrate-binding protein
VPALKQLVGRFSPSKATGRPFDFDFSTETRLWRKTVWLIAALTLSIFVAPIAAREGWAQNPGKVYRVGTVVVLPPNLLPPNAPRPSFPGGPLGRALLDRLADHGYIEGKNLVIEARFGGYERLAELAAELARLHVDVIFTGGTKASRIVSDAVKETPLVIHSCDPFEHVARLSRPEGNLTGVTCMTTELSPKARVAQRGGPAGLPVRP